MLPFQFLYVYISLYRCHWFQETNSYLYYKHVKKTNKADGNNVYIRLKGMEWGTTEADVRKFLHDVDIVNIIMVTNSTGRPTGEAYLKLKSEDDTEQAKVKWILVF